MSKKKKRKKQHRRDIRNQRKKTHVKNKTSQ